MLKLLGVEKSTNPTRDVARALALVFQYVPDPDRMDSWPTRKEIEDGFVSGKLKGDCDDYAFAAAYALHDLGVGARVVMGVCETGEGHAVCEDEHGSVIDSRFPGRVLTWNELERLGYRSSRLNSLTFETDAEPKWRYIKIGSDGCRDYS